VLPELRDEDEDLLLLEPLLVLRPRAGRRGGEALLCDWRDRRGGKCKVKTNGHKSFDEVSTPINQTNYREIHSEISI